MRASATADRAPHLVRGVYRWTGPRTVVRASLDAAWEADQ